MQKNRLSAPGMKRRTVSSLLWWLRSALTNGSRSPLRCLAVAVNNVVNVGITSWTLYWRKASGLWKRTGCSSYFISLSIITGQKSQILFLAAVTTQSRTTGTLPSCTSKLKWTRILRSFWSIIKKIRSKSPCRCSSSSRSVSYMYNILTTSAKRFRASSQR